MAASMPIEKSIDFWEEKLDESVLLGNTITIFIKDTVVYLKELKGIRDKEKR